MTDQPATDQPSPRHQRQQASGAARRGIIDTMRESVDLGTEALGARETATLLARLAGQVAIASGVGAAEARAAFVGGVAAGLEVAP